MVEIFMSVKVGKHLIKLSMISIMFINLQMLLSEKEREEDHVDWYEPRIINFKYFVKEVEVWKREQIAQSWIDPKDSISNVSRKWKGSKASSSVSSACKKAAAENAALLDQAETNMHCNFKNWNYSIGC